MTPVLVAHDHLPLLRVVQRGWAAPLDASHSHREGGRWNAPGAFAVLYASCSEAVARAITYERLDRAGVVLADLQPASLPQLVEIAWKGSLVDVFSKRGVAACGLSADYPEGTGYDRTRPLGAALAASGHPGLLCRSATLSRAGVRTWPADHRPWGEVALFVASARLPRLLRRRRDFAWMTSPRPIG